MEKDLIKALCISYQEALEKQVDNIPTGTCYLSGYCLNEFFKRNGISSELVTGSLAIVDKHGKYAIYGKMKSLKGTIVGDYHAWCEIKINGETLIIDPSQKYNIYALKKYYGIKVSHNIPSIIITDKPITYNWKYYKDETQNELALYYIARAGNEVKNSIILKLQEVYSRF